MESLDSQSTADASEPSDLARGAARAILTAVGEVVYEWTIADDRLRWGNNVIEVLGVGSIEQIKTGRAFASLLEAGNRANRHDAIMNSPLLDEGSGVPYEVQYSLKVGDAHLWIEDIGRWYVGNDGRPGLAQGVLRIINERYEREQRLAFLSRYDELTGYANRSHLLEMLAETLSSARRFRSAISFMIVAIDNFRAINEAYGFDVADQMFAAVAHRIGGTLREGDTVGRYSGNKLGLILINCDDASMHAAAERFHAAVRNEVIVTEAGAVALTVSIGGVALPRFGHTLGEAMARAQEALHSARVRGAGRFVAYSHSTVRQARRRSNAELSSELVAALNEKRFRLALQPVVDAATRKPAFHEGLLRLIHPNQSISRANDFIALSERLGLIRLIDRRALELAVTAVAEGRGPLSFNISAETVADSEWLALLSALLAAGRADPTQMIVEITETAVMRSTEEAARFVALLHDLGCRVAIDDFGAGFSSFRSLRELNVDVIKIDGAFVENLAVSHDDQVFTRTLIELARNFGIKTVAEMVGDEATATLLTTWGVDYLQGDYVGETVDLPAPAAPSNHHREAG